MNINASPLSDLLFHTDALQNKNVQKNEKTKQCRDICPFVQDETNITKALTTPENYDEIGKESKGYEPSAADLIKECVTKVQNNITADTYDKYEELGIIPDKDDPTKYVTVSERIQITLAANCDNYKPEGNISIDDLKSVYGNTGRAYEIAAALNEKGLKVTEDRVKEIDESITMGKDINQITSPMAKYLVLNQKSLTIANLYTAKYSTNEGTSDTIEQEQLDKDSSFSDFERLKPQINQMISNNGLEKDSAIKGAEWLYQNELPITPSNIQKVCDIQAMNQYNNGSGLKNITDQQWIDRLTSYVAYSEKSSTCNVAQSQSIKEQADYATKIIQNSTDNQIKQLVKNNKEITLLNMKDIQENAVYKEEEYKQEINAKEDNKKGLNKDLDSEQTEKYTAATRQLEEIRLSMTTQGFATMIKNGIEISIEPLKTLVEQLKKQEQEYANAVFKTVNEKTPYIPSEADQSLFAETNRYMDEFQNVPSYVLGSVLNKDITFEIQEMTWEGAIKKNVLESAQMAYETLSTKPRKDMGDSLKKAFHGIDGILRENGLEPTSENERAIRILAYNEMEINQTNIEQIQSMDLEVSRLIDNLTPKTTAYLITNGINPLRTNICDLNDELDKINEKIGTNDIEKYSTFLYKLDKNKQISKGEKSAFIGIYKAVNQIEKSDRMAVGTLIKQGTEITLNHLITATKSGTSTGLDVSIDANFGLPEEISISENNTMQRLERYYESLIKKTAQNITPAILSEVSEKAADGDIYDMPLEQFVQYMNEVMEQNEAKLQQEQEQYYDRQVNEMEHVKFISEDALSQLMEDGVTPSIRNLLASNGIVSERGKLYDKLTRSFEKYNKKEIGKKLSDIYENMEDGEKLRKAINDAVSEISSDTLNLKNSEEETELYNTENIEDLRMACHTFQYVCEAAKQNSYYIPINLAGEQTTIHLTIKSSDDEKGSIDIRTDNTQTGQVQSHFQIKTQEVGGYIIMETPEMASVVSNHMIRLKKSFEMQGLIIGRIDVITGKNINSQKILDKKENNGKHTQNTVNNKVLYQTAKTFIGFMKDLCENS